MKHGTHGPIPDFHEAPWWVLLLPGRVRCWLYHWLRIYSPSISAAKGRLSCPWCGIVYHD